MSTVTWKLLGIRRREELGEEEEEEEEEEVEREQGELVEEAPELDAVVVVVAFIRTTTSSMASFDTGTGVGNCWYRLLVGVHACVCLRIASHSGSKANAKGSLLRSGGTGMSIICTKSLPGTGLSRAKKRVASTAEDEEAETTDVEAGDADADAAAAANDEDDEAATAIPC